MTSPLDLSRDGSHSPPSGPFLSPSSNPRNCQDLVVCGAHLPSLRNADTTSLLSAAGGTPGQTQGYKSKTVNWKKICFMKKNL